MLLSLLLVVPALVAAQTNVLGTVTDAGSDNPLPKVRVFGPDSSFLGSSDEQGRFELRLARPLEVVFRKDGYHDKVVALADLTDLLDVQIDLDPKGTRIEGQTVTGSGRARVSQKGSIVAVEEMTGMRFDLQEHLRALPGVSGTREFSSEISVYGSRTHDVTHILGPFPIPNLRHLDFSFPGNSSVLSPRVLQSITIEHDPTKGPLEQGLASALRYQPIRPAQDRHTVLASLGLTNREINVMGPLGSAGGSYVASGRWLDPTLMRHLADRFFAGSPNLDAQTRIDSASSTTPTSKFDLQAFDGYTRIEQGVGAFSLSATAMGAFDDHSAKLSVRQSSGQAQLIPISRGTKGDWLAYVDGQGDLASGYVQFYGGAVSSEEATQLSDTTSSYISDLSNAEDWAAYTKTSLDARLGGVWRPTAQVLGAQPEILASFHQIQETREQGRTFKSNLSAIDDDRPLMDLDGDSIPGALTNELSWFRSRSAVRLRWEAGESQLGLAAGGLWNQESGWGSEATASVMQPWGGIGWLANVSLRQQDYTEATKPGQRGVATTSAWEAKLGAGRKVGPVEINGTVYHRSITDPALPEAPFWWAFPMKNKAKSAAVSGATLQTTWNRWHYLQIQSNLSHVQGTYEREDGATLDWEANRDLDVWTLIKFHPRNDTLFSVLLSHGASLGKPYYSFVLDTVRRELDVKLDPLSQAHPSLRDAFRTDLRIQMDLPSRLPPFRGFRFYAEAQNIFSEFSGDWAKVLGASNPRARSWTPVRSGNALSTSIVGVDPLFAYGTSIFFSFGFEADLGI